MGFLNSLFHDPLKTIEHNALPIILDTAAIATDNPELLPFAQGVGKAGQDLISGKSLGTSLEEGGIQGLETYGLQSGIGAAAGAAGLGDAVTGATGGAGAGAGSWLSNLFSGSPSGGAGVSGGSGLTNLFGSSGNDQLVTGGTDSSGGLPTDIAGSTSSDTLGGMTGGTDSINGAGGNSFMSWLTNGGKAKFGPGQAINAAGLVGSGLMGASSPKGYNQEKTSAGNLAASSKQLESYIQNGTLPPGVQASLNQAVEAEHAGIRSQYASRGMSGSSAEAQDLAAATERGQAEGTKYAMNLLETGIKEAGMSDQIYQFLLQDSMKNDQNLMTNFTKFASGLVGGTGGGGSNGVTNNYYTGSAPAAE